MLEFSEDFFKEEVRNNYTISEKMKKVWAIELELYDFFRSVCKKYNIKYWADGGTLLGAIRHHGFIPWDNDMDIMVLRNDYDKLCEVMKDEIGDLPYFFQTCNTDNINILYAKIRKNGTLCLPTKNLEKHLGINIDIFPFDYLSDDEMKAQKQIMQVSQLFPLKNNKNVRKYILELMTKRKNEYTNTVCNLSVPYHKGCIKYKEDFINTFECKFENTTIPVPNGYDRVLTDLYDDWHQEINDGHDNKILEPDMDYEEYQKKVLV